MAAIRFVTELISDGGYTFISVPSTELGGRQRIRVKGSINGQPFSASAMPWRNNQHSVPINAELRKRLNLAEGIQIEVELEVDSSPAPEVPVPDDLAQALQAHPEAQSIFQQLPPPQRKYYVIWISGVRHPTTRTRRIERVIKMLRAGVDPLQSRERHEHQPH